MVLPDLQISEESSQILAGLIAEPLLSNAALRGQVETHRKLIREAALTSRDVNRELADALALAGFALLDRVGDEDLEDRRRLVQAAVHYFTLDQDTDGDFASYTGLDDDRDVMNAVCDHLGFSDLRLK